jgi:hypothetical protein
MRFAFGMLLLYMGCSSLCGAPKPTPQEDDPVDRDAAPHALEGKPRCDAQAKIALPGAMELGRARTTGSRVIIGARRGNRAGYVDVDGVTARFTEVSDVAGDSPPPLPLIDLVSGGDKKIFLVGYEGAGKSRHLVARDTSAPVKPLGELAPEPPDESLAFDAALRLDGSIVVAWDAPSDDGSAVMASVIRGGKASEPARLSPKEVDADTPRVLALGPTILAMWIAHRPLPKSDAAAAPEGAGQDLDKTWIEMLGFDDGFHPTSPLRHVTPDTGRVTTFDLVNEAPSVPPSIDVVARDGIEMHAGEGGTAIVVHVSGPEPAAPVVLADHVGRGVPLFARGMALFDGPDGRGRAVFAETATPEPALDGARPLAALPQGDFLVASEDGAELRVVRCR